MEVKKFDYQKFIKKSKSLNREDSVEDNTSISTGATGLHDETVATGSIEATGATGATGVIGATGATGIDDYMYKDDTENKSEYNKNKIVQKEVPLPKVKEVEKKELNKKTMMILGVVFGVLAIGAVYYLYKKMKTGKEENNGRKRLLLLNK